ncbi:S53 family peptidase [Actinoplanes sp. NPDC051861]|uniref:S53 family peptidase n=1 Tax=Actinoplanes sp. NPDC051861 TaxID=3155170 RepID=UPI003412E712
MTAAVLAVALGPIATGLPASAAEPGRAAIRSDRPVTGSTTDATPGQRLTVDVFLGTRDTAELERFVAQVSDPRHARYGKYLTKEQFQQRYATTDRELGEVRDWLTGSGLSIQEIPANRRYVRTTGTVAAAERAFGTDLRVSAADGRGPAGAVTVPEDLRDTVTGVLGLSDRPVRTKTFQGELQTPPLESEVTGRPCSAYYGQLTDTTKPPAFGKQAPWAPCGYTPKQIQSAYGVRQAHASGLDGRGVTVAVVASYLSPTLLADLDTYSARHGLPAMKPGQFKVVEPEEGYHSGEECWEALWWSEESLDVDAVHTIAPGANITMVTAASCDDRDQYIAVNKVVDGHLADIVTNSWGVDDERNNAALFDAYRGTLLQAAATGIGVYFSAANSGDGSTVSNDGKPVTAHPASDPLVTAVGGTSLGIGARDERLFETGWATGRAGLNGGAWSPAPPGNFNNGGGGGTSRVFAQPDYQAGKVPDRIATRNGGRKRAVPDVAMLGDPNTGMLIGHTQTFPDGVRYGEYRTAGTSLASPLFAGMMALADQHARRHHGFVNPLLYQFAGRTDLVDIADTTVRAQVRSDYVNWNDDSDGVNYTLRTIGYPQSTATGPGYDDMTGLGSPRSPYFMALEPDPERTR